MTFRESINNLIRSDMPESPTDTIFLFGSIVLTFLQIYATMAKTTIPHVTEFIGFLVLCKSVKVAGTWAKNIGVKNDNPGP